MEATLEIAKGALSEAIRVVCKRGPDGENIDWISLEGVKIASGVYFYRWTSGGISRSFITIMLPGHEETSFSGADANILIRLGK